MDVIWDYMLGGINNFIPENGGQQCREFLSLWQRIAETLILVPFAIAGIIISSRNLEPVNLPNFDKIPLSIDKNVVLPNNRKNVIKYYIVAFYCFIFGSEIIYKLINRTVIFILNPCHIASTIQLLLLTIGTINHKMCLLFRFHMYLLPGALLSILFPAIDSRMFPGEVLTYFAQHLLILAVPFYIVYINGTFLIESFRSFAWYILSFSIIVLYHFSLLQILGWITQANLGYVICPSLNDPFYGRFYRLITVIHQGILVPIITKILNISVKHIIQALHSGALTWTASVSPSTKQTIPLKKSSEMKKFIDQERK